MTNKIRNIVKLCQAGDRDAWGELYDMYSKSLYNVALRIVRDSFVAEEIMHDTIMKLGDNFERYVAEPQKLEFSLRRIAINRAIDTLRQKKVNFVQIEHGHNPEEQNEKIYTKENVDRMYSAIERLPEGYRVILTLKIAEEMSTEEIAQALGITPATVRTQYMRAKQKLTQIIQYPSTER